LAASNKLSCLALSPDDRTLVAGSRWWDEGSAPGEIAFWDLNSRQMLTNLPAIGGMVRSVSFSADGKTLVACGIEPDWLALVDTAKRQVIYTSTNISWQLAMAPDGKTVTALDLMDEERIALFDISTRRISRTLPLAGSASTRYQAFSPDGKTLALWYANGIVRLCHVATGREMITLQGHETFGSHLVFSHDGQALATGSNDKTIRLWRAPRE
jgi:WD40 repeat protein